MGSLYAKDVLDIALAQVGYQADGKWNKFADELDKIDYFSGCGKKQYLDYCSVFTSWSAYKATRNANGEIDPDKWDAHYFLYQPDSNNCAAVVGYVVDYYASHDAYYTNSRDLERGDQMIFQNSKGYSHTGWCYDYDNNYIYTVEGNVNGGKVDKKKYPYSEFGNYIAGFGRPRYDGWEYPEKAKEPVKEDKPEKPTTSFDPQPGKPANKPTFKAGLYTVDVNDYLRIRSEPNSGDNVVGRLFNGAKVTITEVKDGYGKICDNLWVFMDYLD